MPQELDYEFGRQAVRLGDISQDDLETCVEVLVALERVGTRKRLWDVIGKKGLMSEERVAEVRRHVDQSLPSSDTKPDAEPQKSSSGKAEGGDQETDDALRPALPRPMSYVMAHLSPSGKHQLFSLPMRPVSIGKSSACGIALADEDIADRHARLTWNSRGCSIWNVGAGEGVKVNHTAVRLKLLGLNDLIQLGPASLLLLADYGDTESPQPTGSDFVEGPPLARLRVVEGPNKGVPYFLGKRALVLGRHELATVRLDDEAISDFHLHITYTAKGFKLVDLKSKTGVRVNGTRTAQQLVEAGDTISIGPFSFAFNLFGAKRKDEAQAAATAAAAAFNEGEESEWDISADVEVEPVSDMMMGVDMKPVRGGPRQRRRLRPYKPGQLQLTCVEGAAEGRSFIITAPRSIIGRSPDADLLIDDQSLSRQHAEIVLGAKFATVRDLGSRNGQRMRESPLRSGDTIRLGKVILIAESASRSPQGRREPT